MAYERQLSRVFPQVQSARINTIHHQAIKALAPGFAVEAVSNEDGLVEAIRRADPGRSYLAAVQWHPEFHRPGSRTLDDSALLQDFLEAAAAARIPT